MKTNRPYVLRLSLEQRIARAVCFAVTLRWADNGRSRRIAPTLEQAREIAGFLDAGRHEEDGYATIKALTPEGNWIPVSKNAL